MLLSELTTILRAALGLTRADLARATGASERLVRNWKRTPAIRPEASAEGWAKIDRTRELQAETADEVSMPGPSLLANGDRIRDIVAGASPSQAAVGTLAYRLVSYWLPLPAGAVAAGLHRRRYPHGTPAVPA
jgi:transcriptional regulator with XRE-family HTH domain